MISVLTTLILDNLSPFTPNIIECLDKLQIKYICKRYYDNIDNIRYDNVILSGRKKSNKESNVVNSKIIQNCFIYDIPLLGICYGAQIIALALGGTIYQMDRHVLGTVTLTISKTNPLTVDKKSINVYESHKYCIFRLPIDFDSFASSKFCKHEIFYHKKKRIFGTQFHPEKSGHDGIKLFSNFLKLH